MEAKSIKINWAAILAFCTFWTYAFYASRIVNNDSIISLIGSALILSAVFMFFLVMYFDKNTSFKDEFKYTSKDRNVLIFYFFAMLLFSWPELNTQIAGDPLISSMISLMHSIQATYFLVKIFPLIENFEFKNVIYAINILLLVCSCIFIYFFNKLSSRVKLIFYFFVFVVIRIIVGYLARQFNNVHPPLRSFPIWLSTSIFYPSNFSLRFPQFLGLVALMFTSFKFAWRYFSVIRAILFGLAIGTIPILWHVGILVEFSIWGALCVTYLLYCWINKGFDESYSFNLIRISSVASIGILLRESNVICLVLLMSIFIYSYYYETKQSWKNILIALSPVLIALPFVIKTVIVGPPSTLEPIIHHDGLFEQIIFSVTSKIGLYSMLNGALYWILFVPFIFLVYKKSRIIFLLLLLFLLVDYIQFYSIEQWLWGIGRYQAEYVIPFAIVGFFLATYYFMKNRYLYISVCVLLIGINVYVFKNSLSLGKTGALESVHFGDYDTVFESGFLSECVYPYTDALKDVQASGFSKNVYICGNVYGIFPQIFAGYVIKDVMADQKNWESLKEFIKDQTLVKELNKNGNVKIILFSETQDLSIINYLKENGWDNWKIFRDEKYKSSIIGLIRK